MEFKTLFYIIAIIAWLVFKFLEKQKSLLKKMAQTIEPPVDTSKPQVIKPVSQKIIKLPTVNKAAKPAIKNKITSPVEKSSSGNVQLIKPKEEVIELPQSSTLIDEIRSGNVDWRKAIILAEVLRPV